MFPSLALCLLLPLARAQGPAPGPLDVAQPTPACPSKCVCFRTTVRCMSVDLRDVPRVPANTTILDLRFNRIREIVPGSLSHLKNLNTLLLNNNQLSQLDKGVFDGLSQLKYLFLYKNRIQSVHPEAFKDLSNLEFLYLHYNRIESLPKDVFSDLVKLERLFLQNNKIHHLSSEAFKNLNVLQRLRLDGNALVCDCEIMWLSHLLREKHMQSVHFAATCDQPEVMHGKNLSSITEDDMHCKPPELIKEPHDVEVSFGGSAFFTCKAEGDPKPEIVWMRDSNEIDAANPHYTVTSDGLLIEPMSTSDLGVYECMAKNLMGEIKSKAARVITKKDIHNEKLHLLRAPIDTNIKEGESFTLDCLTSSKLKATVQWIKDGLPISENSNTHIDQESGSLTIENSRRSDSGTYTCVSINSHDRLESKAVVTVNTPPFLISSSPSSRLKRGETAELHCSVDGWPTPTVTWYHNGQSLVAGPRITFLEEGSKFILLIESLVESDAGMYTCLAQNQYGSLETNKELRIINHGPRPPRIIVRPFNLDAPQFSSIELPCKAEGEPHPTVLWTRNNAPVIQDPLHRISGSGSLRIYNVSAEDAGNYECEASNVHGKDTASCSVTVSGVESASTNDGLIQQAFNEASADVDRAVSSTLNQLFSDSPSARSPDILMRLTRFPDANARSIARAADVFERTLFYIRKHVTSGRKMNITDDFKYEDVLSPVQVELIANMSGCMTHQVKTNCSDLCFHTKYRTIDGTCNNLQHPMWGASLTGFRRLQKPIYENGFSTPVGWTKSIKYFGFEKPLARVVSNEIIKTEDITPDIEITHMVMQWGQFLDHDLDHAIPSTSLESWEGIDCKKSCAYAAPCFPMDVPEHDPRIKNRRCMDFIRSSAICGSGMTSVFFGAIQPREQINQLTAFIDGSQVYGFTNQRANVLRDLRNDDGLLREGIKAPYDKPLLPIAGATEVDCRRDLTEGDVGCFLAGDIRVNEQVGLIAMHTIWLREHNRIARVFQTLNPTWDGDTIFHETRKLIGAEMQHITYAHWLPYIVGAEGMRMLGEYSGYDPNVDPGITNVFATAALRFGHSLINPTLRRLNENFTSIPEGDLSLGKAFFAPWRIVKEGGVDPLMRGFFMTPAKRKMPNQNLNTQLTEHLFTSFHAVALDLAAMNVQRSRDHGIPGYNEWRKFCNLSDAQTFDDLRKEISSSLVREKLKKLYGHPGNIDVWVGGILEDQLPGARVGPLFRCILIEQFRRIRDGDRFWYENPSAFKPSQLTQIKQTSLARILCDNGDNINKITKDAFLLPSLQKSSIVSCSEIPSVDLRFWFDSTEGCHFVNDDEDEDPRINEVSNEISNNATEARLEGLESVIQDLQKTVKQLKRRMKSFSHLPNEDYCRDHNGGIRSVGDRWSKDRCTSCECQRESQVTCTTLVCPHLTCSSQRRPENECCPICV
ncbi:unnamed protein product [Bemisia tabaci]|uniref:Peroxidase n=1 Tax=Bemisia tabaci TaxID=7038 RepID=A0A9P0A8N3_BEMTA|nr:unnamed protein product [Bemisia tabaci]